MSRTVHVLVADDNPDAAVALAWALGHEGFTVHTATTPSEVVGRAREHPPDVLVMDLMWEGTDGYALTRQVCELTGVRPLLIAMTGLSGLEARSRAAGFTFHFLKPCDVSLLRAVIDNHGRRLTKPRGGEAGG